MPAYTVGSRPRRAEQSIRECCQQGDGLTAEPGWLRGVKVSGLQSENGRRYLAETFRAALPLYEGIKVNLNHPTHPNQPRAVEQRFGRLVNLRCEADGPRADLRFNPHLPMAAAVQWWAENDPGCLGLSHDAIGAGHTEEDGTFVVEQIIAVRSVDLVADPATTRGLYESRDHNAMKKVKLAKLIEALTAPKQAILHRLVEMGYMGAEDELDVPGESHDDHEAALRAGFESGCLAIVKQALAGDMEPKEALAKLRDMLTSHAKLNGKDVADNDKKDDVQAADEHVKRHPAYKALQLRLDKIETQAVVEQKRVKAAQLCKHARLPEEAVTAVFMEQLVGAPDDRAMRALIEDRKGLLGVGKPISLPAGHAAAAKLTDEQFLSLIQR